MKMNFRWKECGAAVLACSAVALTARAAIAVEPNAAPVIHTMSEPGLAADVAVPDAKISLEARRLPLSEVLAAVNKQAKVALSVAPDTFAREPKLTLAVAQMPLREWMESLATLYDVRWEATGAASFRLQASGRSENDKGLRRIGNWYHFWNEAALQTALPDYLQPLPHPDWKAMVDDNLDLQAIGTTGVPFADAPPELQQAVRATIERKIAPELLLGTLMLDVARGPLDIGFTRPKGGTGWTANKGRRYEKSGFTPYNVTADIAGRYGVGLGHIELRPSKRGGELLNDPMMFAPNSPTLAQAATPAQGGG